MKIAFHTLLAAASLSTAAYAQELSPVVSGGVGNTDQATIEQLENRHSLKLVFTGDKGIYLSDVAVSIRDKSGLELVNGVSDGPFLLAELEPGSYTVEAVADGINKKQTISVTKELKVYHMQFPIKDDSSPSSAVDSLEKDAFNVGMYFPG